MDQIDAQSVFVFQQYLPLKVYLTFIMILVFFFSFALGDEGGFMKRFFSFCGYIIQLCFLRPFSLNLL